MVRFITYSLECTGELDFIVIDSFITFAVSENRVCQEVVLINDDVLETDEIFSAVLTPPSESVVITTSSHTIRITDNDSKPSH